nr:MAG TPA: hypothetical protein [Caudoviricetes sp.]
MLIISENELYHKDSFQDVIEHHGVKGMKWGQRMKKWGSAYGGLLKRKVQHPHLYAKAYLKSRGMTGSKLSASTRHMEYRNRVVDDMVKANKQYKQDKRKALGKHDDGDEKIFKKYGQDALFSKRDKKGGESRQDFHARQGEVRKKMSKAYVGLNTRYKNDINNAKAKRARAYVNAGGKF